MAQSIQWMNTRTSPVFSEPLGAITVHYCTEGKTEKGQC